MTNREIDALVAEKVFGWKKDAVHPNLRGSGWWEDRPGSYTCEIPEFSTDPAASKQLRDKMRADGWGYGIDWCPAMDSCEETYRAEFLRFGIGSSASLASTEEMAVALAALKAVGVTA